MAKKNRSIARARRHKRVRKSVVGNSGRPRLNVFRSLTDIYAQVIDDDAGHTLAAASSIDRELRKEMKGLPKSKQAFIVGETLAKRAQEKGIKQVVFDRGGYQYIGRLKALADGARKGGLDF
jgi:large subunit ribosomal protein L18